MYKRQVLTCDSDDNKQLQGIKDYIAQYGDKAVFVVDPSSTANTANIAELCEESGNYVAILAHRADGLYPKDYPHFVASLMLEDIAIGKATAKALFESIGGEGQVAELQGLLGDDSATNRHKAFEAVSYTHLQQAGYGYLCTDSGPWIYKRTDSGHGD